jgi:arylsulfatase A-like enzyme
LRCVLLLFDSLNRLALSPYAEGVETPNFDRLAARAATFTKHYVGSLPCMPARRDLHTGRLSFFHRSWGPLEPFDDSLPEILRANGVYAHLSTDHYHYWEDGGATYHNRYDSYDMIRGQERDPWHGVVDPPLEDWRARFHPKQVSGERGTTFHNYLANRERLDDPEDMPSTRTFSAGLRFIERNAASDGWLLQIETFDPHEPFFTPEQYEAEITGGTSGPIFDWPPYEPVRETEAEIAQLRARYRALVAHCDAQLGRVLDVFDRRGMWEDTALVLTTDHGFLLGEHDWWAKNRMYAYEEISHVPMFVHVPGGAERARIDSLSQTIDVMPTILDLFGIAPPPDVTGRSLLPCLGGEAVREHAVFGYFGGGFNVTDGRHAHFVFPENVQAVRPHQYTLMPTHMKSFFSGEELAEASHHAAFDFTKGLKVLKVPLIPGTPSHAAHGPGRIVEGQTVLFDLDRDPGQDHPIRDQATEARLRDAIAREMDRHDAPREVRDRLLAAAF